jgi:hypothetical protein
MDLHYPADCAPPSAPVERTSTGHRYCACRCGAVVEALSRSVRYASAACAERARVERVRVRSAASYAADASYLNLRRQLRVKGALTPAMLARLDVLRGCGALDPAEARRRVGLPPATHGGRFVAGDPWRAPAPTREGRIPGSAPCTLSATVGGRAIGRAARTGPLHAVLSALDGRPHHDTDPRWSLVPTDAGYGWAVVWRDDMGAQLMGTEHAVRLGATRADLMIAGRGALRWPVVAAGRSRVRLDTLTPVVIRRTVRDARGKATGTHARAECSAASLVSALCQLAAWLGVDASADTLRVEVVERVTEAATVDSWSPTRAGRQLHGDGKVTGWSGWCVLDVNAPARWLLEIAAAGWGLGGKTAFGFGAVRLREVA